MVSAALTSELDGIPHADRVDIPVVLRSKSVDELEHTVAELCGRPFTNFAPGITDPYSAERVGLSNRMIAYYEREEAEPPGCSSLPSVGAPDDTDELLGVEAITGKAGPEGCAVARIPLLEDSLPPAGQRTVPLGLTYC